MLHLERRLILAGAFSASAFFSLISASTVHGQTAPASSGQSLEGSSPCYAGSIAEPATKPEAHSASGTSPGNTGSTGWTGGTGGSHTGTSPQGALPESKTWQPPTARGLDLAMAPAAVPGEKGCGSRS